MMISKQITNQLSNFREEGGFTEELTAERLAYRTEQNKKEEAPMCPK
jgi:four helix bundle suffix protein